MPAEATSLWGPCHLVTERPLLCSQLEQSFKSAVLPSSGDTWWIKLEWGHLIEKLSYEKKGYGKKDMLGRCQNSQVLLKERFLSTLR